VFIRRHPVFLAAITLDLFAVLFGGAVALLPVFAKDILHVGPVGLGWLRAAPALGAMGMALLMTRLPPWQRPGRVLLFVVAGFGLATIGFGLSQVMWLSLLCLFLTGVFDAVSVVIRLTLEQVLTPDRLRGRVSSIHYVFIGFSNELGAVESGGTAALFGPVASVAGGGLAAVLVVGVVAVLWPQLTRLGPLASLRPYES
jgi:MFS family permease